MRYISYFIMAFGIGCLCYNMLFMNAFTDGFIDFEYIGIDAMPIGEKELLLDGIGFGSIMLGVFLFICAGVPVRCPFCHHRLHKTHGHCPNCAKNIFISPHAVSGTLHPDIPAYYWEPETYFYRLHGETFLNQNQVDALCLRIITANAHMHPLSALALYSTEIFDLNDRLPGFLQSEFRSRMEANKRDLIASQK